MEGESWKGEALEIPDFGDTFVFIEPEALFPRRRRSMPDYAA